MSTYKSEGIIISRRNFGESSLILDFYTKDHGKVEAVARSARKLKGKLKGHLELFLHVNLIIARGKHLDKTANSFTLDYFSNLRNNLHAIYAAYYFCELVDKMTIAEHKDDRLYYLLKESLAFLDKFACTFGTDLFNGEHLDVLGLLVIFFQINILDIAGYSAHMQKCVICLNNLVPGENYFSYSFGGVVCAKCAVKGKENAKLNDNAIKLFRILRYKEECAAKEYSGNLIMKMLNIKKIKIKRNEGRELMFVINTFIEFNAERRINSIDLIGKCV